MLKAAATFLSVLAIVSMGCLKSDKPAEVTRIVIHFVEWHLLTYRSLSCEDVANRGDSVTISDKSKVSEFVSIVEALELTELPGYDNVDPRICVVFYDSKDISTKVIKIAHPRHMEIDGHVFEPNDVLFA